MSSSSQNIPTKRLPNLDLLRALAIIMVFFFHYSISTTGKLFWEFAQYGWCGVDLFFVLSGFLIGSQLFSGLVKNRHFSLHRFYLRRLIRTIPNYFVVLLLYSFWPTFREDPNLPPIWKFISFTQNLNLDRFAEGAAFSHAWSLCVEEQFYLIFPLLSLFWIRCSRRFHFGFVVAILLFGFCMRVTLWYAYVEPLRSVPWCRGFVSNQYLKYIYYPTFCRLDGLLCGVFLAFIRSFHPNSWMSLLRRGRSFLFAGIVLLILGLWARQDIQSLISSAFSFPFVSLGFAAILMASMSSSCSWMATPIPGARLIATLAFALYLTHKQVFHLADLAMTSIGWQSVSYSGFIICTIASLIVAWGLYSIVEAPFLKLRDTFLAYDTEMRENTAAESEVQKPSSS